MLKPKVTSLCDGLPKPGLVVQLAQTDRTQPQPCRLPTRSWAQN